MTQITGEIRSFAFSFAPQHWIGCDGRTIPIADYPGLFSLLSNTYGGDGIKTFGVPNLIDRVALGTNDDDTIGRQAYSRAQTGGSDTVTLDIPNMPMHNHSVRAKSGKGTQTLHGNNDYFAIFTNSQDTSKVVEAYAPQGSNDNTVSLNKDTIGPAGDSQPHENKMPYLTINYCIATDGIYPPRKGTVNGTYVESYSGEIKLWSGYFPPRGWAFCQGQLLPIAGNGALYSLLGTQYGGDGKTTFALPDLRGRAMVGAERGSSKSTREYLVGQKGGAEAVTLRVNEMPEHNHEFMVSTHSATTPYPHDTTYNMLAAMNYQDGDDAALYYLPDTDDTEKMKGFASDILEENGSNIPHDNMMPFISLQYIICIDGEYPS